MLQAGKCWKELRACRQNSRELCKPDVQHLDRVLERVHGRARFDQISHQTRPGLKQAVHWWHRILQRKRPGKVLFEKLICCCLEVSYSRFLIDQETRQESVSSGFDKQDHSVQHTRRRAQWPHWAASTILNSFRSITNTRRPLFWSFCTEKREKLKYFYETLWDLKCLTVLSQTCQKDLSTVQEICKSLLEQIKTVKETKNFKIYKQELNELELLCCGFGTLWM